MYRIFLSLFPKQCRTISTDVAVCIKINLEMTSSMQEVVHRLYADVTPFYIKDLSSCRFWCICGRTGGPESNLLGYKDYSACSTLRFRN